MLIADMSNIIVNKVKLVFFRGVEGFVKPLLGYKIGNKIPLIARMYRFIYEFTKPRMVNVFEQWLILHPDDQVFSNEILSKGVFEEFEISLFSSFLQKGMIVFDIGANVGYYTLIAAAKVGNSGRVYAFEPDKDNFDIIQKNIALNNHCNVELLNYAVADENGYLELSLSPENKGDHRTYKSGNIIKDREHYRVKAIALDSFFESKNIYPSIIKMDIQGFEYFAIQGMKNLIIQTPELVLLTEFWPYGISKHGLDLPHLFYQQLECLGFEIFKINEDSKRISKVNDVTTLLKSLSGEAFTNLLCVKGKFINFIDQIV